MIGKKRKLLEEQLAQCMQSNEALRAQLANSEHRVQSLEDELKSVSEKLNDSNSAVASMKNTLSTMQSQIDAAENEINAKKGDLAGTNRKLDELRLRHEASTNELVHTQAERDSALAQLKSKRNELDSVNRKFSEFKQKYEASASTLADTQEQLAAVQSKLKTTGDEAIAKASALSEANRKIDELNSKCEETDNFIFKLQKELSDIHAKLKIVSDDSTIKGAALAEANSQIEELKNKREALTEEIVETHARLASISSELKAKNLELADANVKLNEFRLRQEAIVSALTDAHDVRERTIIEANAEAKRITEAANHALEVARQDAISIKSAAEAEAESIISNAKTDADNRIKEVDAIIAERHEQLLSLNSDITSRARMAIEQTELYANMLTIIANSQSVEVVPAECDYDCEQCDKKCDSFIPETSVIDSCESNDIVIESPSSSQECIYLDTPQQEVPDVDSTEAIEVLETAESNNNSAATNDIFNKEADEAETCVANDTIDNDKEYESAFESAFESIANSKGGIDLPEANKAGNGVGELMRSIYSIEGREAPDESKEELDSQEGTPIVFDDPNEIESSPIPFDSDLASILEDIL